MFKRLFKYETMVQFDEQNQPCICGYAVKRLEDVEIKCFSRNKAEKLLLKQINEKYPQYNGLVQLW